MTTPPVNPELTPGTAAVASVAVTLRCAASYLTRHGWTQVGYYDWSVPAARPPACAVGAIGAVCYGEPVEAPEYYMDHPQSADVQQALQWFDDELIAAHGRNVFEFNDAPGRSALEVVTALHNAAQAWDHAHSDPTAGGVS
jgi:hypothetical protein